MTSAADLLAGLPEEALRALAHGLRSGNLRVDSSAPRLADALGIDAADAARIRDALEGIADESAVAFACDCAVAARREGAAKDLTRHVELVISGPVVGEPHMRPTDAVFRDLIAQASREVLITSYVASHSREILEPLAAFLEQDETRTVTIVLDFKRGTDGRPPDVIASELATRFWRYQWPADRRRPRLYYDPRALLKQGDPAQATMHAKVVVVDRRAAFVTSANLTERAQEQNVELGLLVHHEGTAGRIADYFQTLIARGDLTRAP
jgi:phosphatidylserine/phosphatidylglycerophosphate/cardiolipin synthase-like enzyme